MRFVVFLIALGACQSTNVSRGVGARCDTNAECDTKCMGPSSDWPDGFCTELCDTSANCPDDTRCIDEEGGVCAFPCAATADCTFLGPQYSCQDRDSKGAGAKVMVCRGG